MNKIYYKLLLHLPCRPVTSPLLSARIQTHQLSYTHVSIFYDCHRIERSLCLCFMAATDRKKLVFVFYSLCIFATRSKGPCVSLLTRAKNIRFSVIKVISLNSITNLINVTGDLDNTNVTNDMISVIANPSGGPPTL